MAEDHRTPGSRFMRWFHKTFDDWFFRSMIGPAQTANAVHGCEQPARDQWKRDLEARKQFTRNQRARKRLAREGRQGA
ncbi:hypothetical protein AB0M36_20845 [Actinoplanes sp. NPDC051346]|uniref:hypothetical protein n=1 Tax=Actinoplanes sp. NPDC051346 TaxID=3155048 RepID=UPI00342DB6BA